MIKVVWSQRALTDIEHIYDYIAQDSPLYAQLFTERLLRSVRQLQQFPESGRIMPEAQNTNIREIIYQGYRVVYRLRDDVVEVVMVVHSSRDMSKPDNQPA